MMIDLPPELLRSLYTLMLRIRLCEESLVGPILEGEIRCPVHLCSGEEAIAVGVCMALEKTDFVLGNHRSHGHFLAKGGSMKAMVAEIFGKETGCSRGRGGSMHLIDPDVGMIGSAPIVAGTISLAVGAALAAQIRRDGRVSVTFFGDGATNEGVLFESMNFAALRKLPIIFVCENNFYATHMPVRDIRPDVPINETARALGIATRCLDGNNVLDVYHAAGQAVESCRQGKGPVFLECLTYRQRGHVGPDDNIQGLHTDIRPKGELEEWLNKDPIDLFQNYLLGNEIITEDEIKEIQREVEDEVKDAHLFALNSDYPGENDLDKYVFK